ncbi:hypothetical protein [Novosphingobium sp. Gsoil 351]|uniref:hypothetical protein n=1 Tax=Novosphingobium sp. Gsoil 351 TaxID=2675225 RepID=UPI0012B4F850|nr:hypothetical protein [Novosphingobium sp. Gsoil 351]QGN56118.1 hypothetical protein GKE62_17765 [Novosphingobium sp. Gsoil 351]
MTRVDPESLATHLEVALACSPPAAIAALTHADRYHRTKAIRWLALYLAERLDSFELTAGWDLAGAHPTLFE